MSIKITGLKEIETKLKALQSSLDGKGMKSTMNTIGNMVKNEIEESFENERSPFGDKWKPISANTAFAYAGGKKKAYFKNKKRQRKPFLDKFGAGGSKKILRVSGDLADKWSLRSTSNQVTISNNTSSRGFAYGLTHQFGSKKANIPKRPFLPVGDDGVFKESLKDDILDFLSDKFDKLL